MFAKLEITGTVKSETGMHIGGSDAFAAIGAIDSPVVRDVLTNHPMIPGSSLKGKMRSLLARQYSGGKPKKLKKMPQSFSVCSDLLQRKIIRKRQG